MPNNKLLATDALTKALRLRKQLGIPMDESVSALDAAENLGIEVRMIDLPSMEGMYMAGSKPKIMLSCLRPQGRRSFTCAHEIGHHIFEHGEQFDELTDEKSTLRKHDSKEYSADCFAAFFLMPKTTIDSGMKRRGLAYETLEPVQVYALASWLGVGYSTLVNHMQYGICMISSKKAQYLNKLAPKDIRQIILSYSVGSSLHMADEHWVGRAIDCEVGDFILLPQGTRIEGTQLILLDGETNRVLIKSQAPGVARVVNEELGWAAFIRVSPPEYVGRSCYRFEEEVP